MSYEFSYIHVHAAPANAAGKTVADGTRALAQPLVEVCESATITHPALHSYLGSRLRSTWMKPVAKRA